MKRIFYSLLLIAISINIGFSQTSSKKKAQSNERQKLLAMREKFDPLRNPNEDLAVAIVKAQKEKKRIILDIGGEWCSWCIKMDIYFIQHKDLEKLRDKNFIWVKINMSQENENNEFLAKYPEIQGYPHLYVLESNGTLLHSQNTSEIEEPDLPLVVPSKVKNKEAFMKKEREKRAARSYDLSLFKAFLSKWSPK